MFRITTMLVKVRSTSPVAVTVRVPQLHGTSGGLVLQPGESQAFRVGNFQLEKLYLSGNTGIVDWGAISGTTANG